jgi:hypothetical protein
VCVAVPVLGQAWEVYRTDWVQLDAPRHFYLHSEKSMTRLAQKAGFAVHSVEYDSGTYQFWGSEQFRRDIHCWHPSSHSINPRATLFSPEQMLRWHADAQRLNVNRRGDHATFYLRPSSGYRSDSQR